MSDELLILHCAPTLAGLKTGSLFSYRLASAEDLSGEIRELNRRLKDKGVRIVPLMCKEGRALLYLYRPDRLERDLSGAYANRILARADFPTGSSSRRLTELARRLKTGESFPHEIGLFLGYPPEDVDGFITYRAGNFKCIGTWKVYGDEGKARELFRSYTACTACYCRQSRRGVRLEELVV